MPKYLYTYLPKNNTAEVDGIQSTAFSPEGYRKYINRAKQKGYGKPRADVLSWLDNSIPNFRRSYAVSFLTEPIPKTAPTHLKQFADTHTLFRVDPALLLASGVVARIAHPNKGTTGGAVVDKIQYLPVDWHVKQKKQQRVFSQVPHYFLETTKGIIPSRFIEKV